MQGKIDESTMNTIKNLVEKGDISQAISQISPEMLENFSSMLNNSTNSSISKTNNINNRLNYNHSNNINNNIHSTNNSSSEQSYTNTSNHSQNNNTNNFDFSNIDMNTILKMKSIMENMNNKNDPSHNLLYSLKPYLRESKQEKIDQYANLLNISKIAEAFNNSNLK